MNNQGLVTLLSSDGFVLSVSDENIVIPPDSAMTAFAWKQLSIVAKQDCTIEVNKDSINASTFKLIANLAIEVDRMPIKTLAFKESNIEYYFFAGY